MNTSSSNSKQSFSLGTLFCSTFGHNYLVTRKVTDHINEYKCSHCGQEVAENFSGNLELLTNRIKRTNSCLASFFQRRRNRISA